MDFCKNIKFQRPFNWIIIGIAGNVESSSRNYGLQDGIPSLTIRSLVQWCCYVNSSCYAHIPDIHKTNEMMGIAYVE